MNRSDTIRAVATRCRSSHAACLLAVGWLTLDQPSEVLEQLLEVLEESRSADILLDHLMRYEALVQERYGRQR